MSAALNALPMCFVRLILRFRDCSISVSYEVPQFLTDLFSGPRGESLLIVYFVILRFLCITVMQCGSEGNR